jgi:hypothetical protein
MQLPAGQTSLEPHPHREQGGPPTVREPEHPAQGDGSRFASEPACSGVRRISDPRAPSNHLNKLPVLLRACQIVLDFCAVHRASGFVSIDGESPKAIWVLPSDAATIRAMPR